MPGNYDSGYFEDCLGDSGLPMGVYGSSTWQQSEGNTPPAHPKPSSSDCVRVASLTPGSVQLPTPSSSGAATVTVSTLFTTSSTAGQASAITFVEAVATLTATPTTSGQGTATGQAAGGAATGSSGKSAAQARWVYDWQLLGLGTMGMGLLLGALAVL